MAVEKNGIGVKNVASKLSIGIENSNKCAQCGKHFSSKGTLTRHLITHLEKSVRPKFKCSFNPCPKEFLDKGKLKQHVESVHLGTFIKFRCSFCLSQFMSKTNRDSHIVSAHTLEKAYKCEKCPAKFPAAAHLIRKTSPCPHRSPTTSLPNLWETVQDKTCPKIALKYCSLHQQNAGFCVFHLKISIGKRFFGKFDLKKHARTHTQANKIGCYFCRKEFTSRSDLDRQTRSHTREKPFRCSVGNCWFSSCYADSLRSHLQRHGAQTTKTWSCYFCNDLLRTAQSLEDHLRFHTKEEPFQCGLCLKRFRTQPKLAHHIYSHTNEKPYKCEDCQRSFVLNGDLQMHIRVVHRQEKRYFCKSSDYASYRKDQVVKHEVRHSAKPS